MGTHDGDCPFPYPCLRCVEINRESVRGALALVPPENEIHEGSLVLAPPEIGSLSHPDPELNFVESLGMPMSHVRIGTAFEHDGSLWKLVGRRLGSTNLAYLMPLGPTLGSTRRQLGSVRVFRFKD